MEWLEHKARMQAYMYTILAAAMSQIAHAEIVSEFCCCHLRRDIKQNFLLSCMACTCSGSMMSFAMLSFAMSFCRVEGRGAWEHSGVCV
jgi:hypothetical protein